MSRRPVAFACQGSECFGTLDDGPRPVGLLIVSGGNEIRAGAWNGQAQIAARVAAAGYPVFRYDRRGVGDSAGDNPGFRESLPDIEAAIAAFRQACPGVRDIVAFGNCDAAAALMLASGAGCRGLVLSNPWTIEDADESDDPPPEAVRAHYARRLRDPAALLRLLRGRIAFRALVVSLRKVLAPAPPSSLAAELRAGLAGFNGPVRILLADRDRTAQVFLARWDSRDPRLRHCAGASHSFVEPTARDWLEHQLLDALAEVERGA
ncbi:hydrolase 1, exosortase A system-associated [Novosphingobium flavum]|uniref:Hydrolase 1, exosortase A system-associated n=1 Tax=Novosphingobium aerophilum TaxID=2839843 RepID=A0A7X1KBB1_9SPHN|nr:hydrolase 1, exosortase A system-associated [Novosphingobium aerophilum]MBC2650872.1 hydrolase 1, exosortase A system-associated [Novosphingobium aerophilum]MBC2661401.1 hydrolase 1, exosortase A system-associated [Novosphingobium aerophilum]